MYHSFNTHSVGANAKEYDVIANRGQPCIRSKLRPESIDFRLLCDLFHPGAEQPKYAQSMPGAIGGDEVRNLFQIAWYTWRKTETHY